MPLGMSSTRGCVLLSFILWGTCAAIVTGFQSPQGFALSVAADCRDVKCRNGVRPPAVAARREIMRVGARGMIAQVAAGLPMLECVKNTRDLASVSGSPVKPGRVFRAACVGTANENDACMIVENIKTLIDLRSDKEYLKDEEKYNSTVWENYEEMIYSVKKSKSGRATALVATKVS